MGHLQDWADGVSSSKAVKRHMEYAVADGVTHHMVERLSKTGCTDGSMQHCHSDLMAIITQVVIPELITHVTEEGSVDDMVLPSTLIRCWHNHNKARIPKTPRVRHQETETVLETFVRLTCEKGLPLPEIARNG